MAIKNNDETKQGNIDNDEKKNINSNAFMDKVMRWSRLEERTIFPSLSQILELHNIGPWKAAADPWETPGPEAFQAP